MSKVVISALTEEDLDYLREHALTDSQPELAKHFGVSPETITNWITKFNIKDRPEGYLTTKDVMRLLGFPSKTFVTRMKEAGLKNFVLRGKAYFDEPTLYKFLMYNLELWDPYLCSEEIQSLDWYHEVIDIYPYSKGWTAADSKYAYAQRLKGRSPAAIAEKMNKAKILVHVKLIEQQQAKGTVIGANKFDSLTQDDIQYLRGAAGRVPVKTIARKYSVDNTTIYQWFDKLGLSSDFNQFTDLLSMKNISELIGTPRKNFYKSWKAHGFEPKVHGREAYVSEAYLCRFMKNNPTLWNVDVCCQWYFNRYSWFRKLKAKGNQQMSHNKWTPSEIRIANRMYSEGKSYDDIADVLHRTRRSVYNFLYRYYKSEVMK